MISRFEDDIVQGFNIRNAMNAVRAFKIAKEIVGSLQALHARFYAIRPRG